ncbi:MAG TPA: DUF3857 domain-containing transglutaminase family protein [Chthoniobacter sp.]|jgi:hypothetical protein
MAGTNPELELEPLSGELPEAVGFSPELATTTAVDAIGAIPSGVLEKVTITPPEPWVVERELEEKEGATATNPWLLMDRQFRAEGCYIRDVHRLDTLGAVRRASQWRVDFDPRNERLIIHSLAVIRGEQRGENAKVERLRVLQREAGLEGLNVGGLLTVVVLMEDVRVGDVLDLSYTVEGRSLVCPDRFACWITMPEGMRVQAFHLSARFATGRAMRWKSNDPQLTPTVREEGGETEWSWQSSGTPRVEMERNVPARFCLGRWIQISDFASWAEVAAGVAAAWKEDLECAEIVELAESISAAGGTPAQRIERALTFLQDEVRYLSVSGELGGQVPTPPGLVLRRRFGDCKDKSFAAAHLLRRLGTPARPVLVHSVLGPAVQDFLPMLGVFNHAIVEYEVGGERRWVDVTASLQGGTALTRPGAPFRLGLPIGPGVQDLEPIATDGASHRLELRETFFLDTSGRTSSLRVAVTAGGREAEYWRRSMAEIGTDDFARSRERFLQRIFRHAKRAGKLEWEDDRQANEFVVGEVFDLNEGEDFNYKQRAARFRMTAHTIQAVLGYHHVGKREHPWALQYPCRIKHVLEIDSPSLQKPQAKVERVNGKAFRFSCHWQGHQGLATITFSLQTLKDAVPPEEFEAFKLDVQEVWRKIGIMGRLPPGSAVSWKKRSPDSVLPRRRNRMPSEAPGAQGETDESGPLPALAPALAPASASPEAIAPRSLPGGGAARSGVAPRKESAGAVLQPLSRSERKEIRRPNFAMAPENESSREARADRRRARRQARQRERMMFWGGGALIVVLLVVVIIIAIRFR